MAKLLLGKEVTDALNASLQTRTAVLREKGTVPTLGIIRVGANPSDLSYEKGAVKRAELVGVEVKKFELPADATKEDVLAAIDTDTAQTWRYQMVIYSTTADGGTKDRYLSMMNYCTRMQEFIDGLDFTNSTADVPATEAAS